ISRWRRPRGLLFCAQGVFGVGCAANALVHSSTRPNSGTSQQVGRGPRDCREAAVQDKCAMPKLKTHKGIKKRFKVSATGKVSHKRCGSSHLMSHKNGKQVRRLRKKSVLKISAEAHRLRRAVHERVG